MTVIVTSGRKYLDIDAYACIVAYAELLNLEGVSAVAVSTAELNQSITQTARAFDVRFQDDYKPAEDDEFVLVDVSEPENVDSVVDINKTSEVIDHHLGFEEFWESRGVTVDIEFIGAACTQVYERWVKAGLLEHMSLSSAQLLTLGILDNTLNFKADVCTPRDIDAYKELISYANLPQDWAAQYFLECQSSIEKDVVLSISNDTKIMNLPGYDLPIKIGQAVVWDAREIIEECWRLIEDRGHFINVISISEGRNYLIIKDMRLKNFVVNLLRAKNVGEVFVTDRLWLRKEIMKQAIEESGR